MPFSKRNGPGYFWRGELKDARSDSVEPVGPADTEGPVTFPADTKFLIVINSTIVTSTSQGDGKYILRVPIDQADDVVVVFSDRPERIGFRISSQEFTQLFAEGTSYREDPPNAAVDYRDPRTGARRATLVQIDFVVIANNSRDLLLYVTERGFRNINRRLDDGIEPIMACTSIFVDAETSTFTNAVLHPANTLVGTGATGAPSSNQFGLTNTITNP